LDILLQYLVPSRSRRDLWQALRSRSEPLTIRALAARAGVGYANAHREVMRMRAAGLLRTEVVGSSMLCSWDAGRPAARKLAALLDASEDEKVVRATDDAVYGSLKSWGAGLVRGTPPAKPLSLEETLARGVELARRDPFVAQVWPVVLARNRDQVDLDRLEFLVRRSGQKRALGLLLSITGTLMEDPTVSDFARRFRDGRVRKPEVFFTIPVGKRFMALAKQNTPLLAKKWSFILNTSMETLRSHFDKFVERR
jgi:DNA-binding transcriptional ArsR family regulator